MNKFILLVKTGLLNSFNIGAITRGKFGKKGAGTAMLILLAVVVGGLGGALCYFYLRGMGAILEAINAIHLLPTLILVLTSLITFMTSIFKAPGTLFGFKDYDALMSLPIKTSTIIATKILLLYSFHIFIDLIIAIPGGIVYMQLGSPSPVFWVYYLVCILLAPLVPMFLGTIIGMIITLISARFKRNAFVTILLTVLFMVGVMYFSFGSAGLGIELENNPLALLTLNKQFTNLLHGIYPLAKFFTNAIWKLSVVDFLIFCGISLGFFVVFCAIVGKFFKAMHTFISTKKTTGNYEMTSLKTSGVMNALFKKELKRYFGSSVYVFNTAAGVILLLIGTGLLAIKGADFLQSIPELPPEVMGYIELFIPMLLSFLAVTCCTTAASISMEGNTLWILKVLPISTRQIIRAKVWVNLTILVPFVILCSTALLIAFPTTNIINAINYYAMPLVFSYFISYFGMLCNLIWPKLNWTSEASVIKRSMAGGIATLVGVFSAMGIIGLAILVLNFFPSFFEFYPMVVTAIMLVITIVIISLVHSFGVKKFESIEA